MAPIRTARQADEPERPHGDNTPQPIRSLRDWLDHLALRDRLVVLKPGMGLRFELAAVAKRLDGSRATLFPRPGGHAIPVVSGLVSDRGWMADAMGVEPDQVLTRFQDAALESFEEVRQCVTPIPPASRSVQCASSTPSAELRNCRPNATALMQERYNPPGQDRNAG